MKNRFVLEMEIQERTDTEQENLLPEESPAEDSENRIYNGFQGPLTEAGESSMLPGTGSSSSTLAVRGHILLLLLVLL